MQTSTYYVDRCFPTCTCFPLFSFLFTTYMYTDVYYVDRCLLLGQLLTTLLLCAQVFRPWTGVYHMDRHYVDRVWVLIQLSQ